jgi:hypothetical protein
MVLSQANGAPPSAQYEWKAGRAWSITGHVTILTLKGQDCDFPVRGNS